MSKKPADYIQRQQALDPTASIICEAPAGSGKTELLTQRFLTLLTRVNSPEEIVAITFTRKAAGEMRERILAALTRGLDETQPESEHQQQTWNLARKVIERDKSYAWNIVNNPNRLNVLTFDSLCAKLANSLPLHSSFGAPPQVVENAEEYYRMAARSVLQTLEEDKPWSDAIADILRHLDNNVQRLENLLVKMLGQREAWLPLIGSGFGVNDMESSGGQHVISVLEDNLARVQHDVVEKLREVIPNTLHKPLIEFCAFAASHTRGGEKTTPLDVWFNQELELSELPDCSGEGLALWQGVAHLLLKADDDWRKSLDKRIGFPAGDNAEEKKRFKEVKQSCLSLIATLKDIEGLHELLMDLRTLPASHYQSEQKRLLVSLSYVLPVLSAYLSLVFREKNSVDFSEISIKARLALGAINRGLEAEAYTNEYADTVSELALKLDYAIQHVLIDEFQDTSPAQIELLTQLTQGWTPDDGRTLFCVGDAMQSIYGFRGANVGLFIRCIEHGLGHIPLKPIQLNTNFRSQAGVVNWINDVFVDAFPARSDISDGAVHYSHSIAFQNELPDPPVCADVFAEGKTLEDEAQRVLDIIRESHCQDPEASVAILIRSRSHVAHITPALQNAGIKYRAVDLEPLGSNMLIQDLLMLTQALLDPADRIAWLSVLRAPWCGLSLDDIENLVNLRVGGDVGLGSVSHIDASHIDTSHIDTSQIDASLKDSSQSSVKKTTTILQQLRYFVELYGALTNSTIGECAFNDVAVQADLFAEENKEFSAGASSSDSVLSDDGRARVLRVAPVLLEAYDNLQRKSLRQWIEGAWLSIGGPACFTKPADLKNAQLFFELLEKLDSSSVLEKKSALLDSLQNLFAVPDPAADERLQIMTIHKSKGLEFDVVIVPQLHRTSRSPDPELLRWYERLTEDGETHLLMAPITASGKDKDPIYQHLVEQEKKKSAYENCRLLYVACTRAKKRLYLSALVSTDAKKPENKFQNTAKSSLMNAIWMPLQLRAQLHRDDTLDLQQAESRDEIDVEQVPVRPISRLPKDWHLPTLPEGHTLDAFIPFYQHNNDNHIDLEIQDATTRIVGTLVHRVMQQFGECEDHTRHFFYQEDFFSRQESIWRNKMLSLGLSPVVMNEALQRVRQTVQRVLADNRFLNWVSVPATHRYHEFPVTLASDQGVNSRGGETNLGDTLSAKQLIIDMLIDQGSELWIIDFKTSQPLADEELNNFIDKEKRQYATQIRQYKKAIGGLSLANDKTVNAGLYFPNLGVFAEYSS